MLVHASLIDIHDLLSRDMNGSSAALKLLCSASAATAEEALSLTPTDQICVDLFMSVHDILTRWMANIKFSPK